SLDLPRKGVGRRFRCAMLLGGGASAPPGITSITKASRRPAEKCDFQLFLFLLARQLGNYRKVFKRGDIAYNLVAGYDFPQQPAHDFAAAGFGKSFDKANLLRLGEAANLVSHPVPQLLCELIAAVGTALLERDKRAHGLARDLVRPRHYSRLGDGRMADQRRLQSHRAQAMAADVHHVIHAAQNPEVPIFVTPRCVASKIDSGNTLPILLLIPLWVPV